MPIHAGAGVERAAVAPRVLYIIIDIWSNLTLYYSSMIGKSLFVEPYKLGKEARS